MRLPLISLTLLYLSLSLSCSFFLSFSLTLLFFPCQSLELPQNSQAAQNQRKSFLGLIHTYTQLPRQICPPLIRPPTDILFVSSSSSALSDEHKPGRRGVNRRAMTEKKTERKHNELLKNNRNSCQLGLLLTGFSSVTLCFCVFCFFLYLELVDPVDQIQ